MVSELAFIVLVVAVGIQRLAELRLSRHNEVRLFARGGRESAPQQLVWMKIVHTLWLISMPLEVLVFARPFIWPLALISLGLFLAGQTLRYAAIRRLGDRWTVRIITIPGAPLVTHGIYRRIRHPNYLGVVLEVAALPLMHTAWLTSVVFSV